MPLLKSGHLAAENQGVGWLPRARRSGLEVKWHFDHSRSGFAFETRTARSGFG